MNSVAVAIIFILDVLKLSYSLNTETEFVTFGSAFKLLNVQHQMRLFSGSNFLYGGVSNQQAVSGQSPQDDTTNNTLWIVESFLSGARRGQAIKCGEIVTWRHMVTDKTLHICDLSSSPLTYQHLISAQPSFHPLDEADTWFVECPRWNDLHWVRSKPVKLMNVYTRGYLSLSGEYYHYPTSLHGHMEAVGSPIGRRGDFWSADQGIFFNHPSGPTHHYHTEL